MPITDDIRRIINMADRGNSRMTPGERYAIVRVQAWLDGKDDETQAPVPIPAPEPEVVKADDSEKPVTVNQPVGLLELEEYIVDMLEQAGFDSISEIRDASDKDLLDVKGIGPNTLREIRAAVEAW